MALTGESYGIEEKPVGSLGEMTQDRGCGGRWGREFGEMTWGG